jgi:hypothetical protein
MSVTSSTVSTPKIDAYNADKPLFLGLNRLEGYSRAKWTVTLDSTWSNMTDIAQEDHPITRSVDRYAHMGTRAKSAAEGGTDSNQYFLVYDLGSPSGSESAEAVVIYPGNFDKCSPTGNVDISVVVSTDSNFASADTRVIARLRSLGSAGSSLIPGVSVVSQRVPLIEVSLHSPTTLKSANTSYNNYQYVLLDITTGPSSYADDPTSSGANFTVPPMINEVFLTQRHQMSRNPDQPFSDYALESEYADFESKTGVRSRYVKHAGARTWSQSFTVKSGQWYGGTPAADLYGLNDFTGFKSLWADTLNYGTRAHVFLPNPKLGEGYEYATTPSSIYVRSGSTNAYFVQTAMEEFSLSSDNTYDMVVEFDIGEVYPYLTNLLGQVVPYNI